MLWPLATKNAPARFTNTKSSLFFKIWPPSSTTAIDSPFLNKEISNSNASREGSRVRRLTSSITKTASSPKLPFSAKSRMAVKAPLVL